MKKLLSLLLALTMCLSLAACGGDDKQTAALKEAYNKVAVAYNEAVPAAQENGWLEDEQTSLELQTAGAVLEPIGAALDGGDMSALGDADIDALIEQLDLLAPAMEDLVERVSVPYGE